MFALVAAYRAGLLRANNWFPNIIAGVIVGIVALALAACFSAS